MTKQRQTGPPATMPWSKSNPARCHAARPAEIADGFGRGCRCGRLAASSRPSRRGADPHDRGASARGRLVVVDRRHARSGKGVSVDRLCALLLLLQPSDLSQRGRRIEMELAESVESDDAQTWQVKLKPGVTFHDGKPLTSADVVYSLQRHLDEAVGSKVNSIAKQMSEISATDDLTVKVVLAEANADLPTIFALHHFMIIADGTTDFSKANGTGAFICDVFEPGVKSIVVDRTPTTSNPKVRIWTATNSSASRITARA